MNSLDSQITALYTLAHELLYLGSDGSPIYSDHFSRLNGDVLSRANTLYPIMAPPTRKKPVCAFRF